ncbi:hypothetical protein HOLleu_40843 [Holothuria leucospilota]|uniref:Uncharacterized protein n=1 Tax=Holothuria leucospilota TaxID=206669 RepID=A0A9Q1BDW8_HOLLE|nr:hypothetical protein HOLleu_40843 [Holothuria leucospilota]
MCKAVFLGSKSLVDKEREKNIAITEKENPRNFWSYVHSKSKTKATVSNLHTDNTNLHVTPCHKEKAEILAEGFTSVFTVEGGKHLPDIQINKMVPELMKLLSPRILL